MKVKLTKIKESADPLYSAAKWADWKFGDENPGVSIPIDYELTGELLRIPKIDEPIIISRESRNGVAVSGFFRSSRVKSIAKKNKFDIIETENSIYKMEKI